MKFGSRTPGTYNIARHRNLGGSKRRMMTHTVFDDDKDILDVLKKSNVRPGDKIKYSGPAQGDDWEDHVIMKDGKKSLLYRGYITEFGKKGDAKKAMRIHHREGISLKAAWKRVQGASKKKPTKKRSKRGLTKTQSLAKKAMKLHHSKGIPLKKAWKMVQKFGATSDMYSPPGLVDYEFNPETGKYRKLCADYQVRDPMGRCRGRKPVVAPPGKEINPATGRLRKICELPKSRNDRGRCVGPRKGLKPGYVINPRTGRPQLASREGYYRDPVTNRWRKIPRIAGNYDPSNSSRNLNRIRNTFPDDISDYSDDMYMVFGKKQFKCGFGGCSACALKSNFGKRIKTVRVKEVKKSISLSDLQGIARANGISLTECKELGKTRLQAKLKRMGLLNKKNTMELDYNTIPFTFFGKKLKFGNCQTCSKK